MGNMTVFFLIAIQKNQVVGCTKPAHLNVKLGHSGQKILALSQIGSEPKKKRHVPEWILENSFLLAKFES
jgi:hypothetical protein